MLYKFTTILLVVLLFGFLQAQERVNYHTAPKVVFTGDETPQGNGNGIVLQNEPIKYDRFVSGGLVWEMNQISLNPNSYDLQSNSSAQQLWCDINTPNYLHMIYTFSGNTTYTDRVVMYYGSTDGGVNWFELGPVPVNTGTEGRSGYGTISGMSDGRAVIMSHPQYGAQNWPRSTVYIDNSAFEYNFTAYDPYVLNPGLTSPPIWPRLVVDGSDNVIFGSSQSTNYGTGQDSMYTNRFDIGTLTFDGWQVWQGDQAETYPLEMSPAGKIGQAYLGEGTTTDNGDIFYRESTDGGLTWEASQKIYTHTEIGPDTGFGAIRGITVNFYGEEPCIAFETSWQVFSLQTYSQSTEQELLFWSPNINGGVPKVLVDSNWINYNVGGPANLTNDVYLGVSRPVLSRSESGDYLFLAFSAASAIIDTTNGDQPFFDGYFMYSTDGGDTWTDPEKFTPDMTPPMDWRYHSIARISPVHTTDEDVVTIHITAQGDPVAGSYIQGPVAAGVTAHMYHFTTQVSIVSAGNDPIVVNEFDLEQNYPNPFNPSTSINYTLAERSNVSLKVYDVLGNELATLVNTTQEAGAHTLNFDASDLASGLYIYTLNAGNFTSSKKMLLLK